VATVLGEKFKDFEVLFPDLFQQCLPRDVRVFIVPGMIQKPLKHKISITEVY